PAKGDVLDVCPDCDCDVGRQRPRGGRPNQETLIWVPVAWESDSDSRILARPEGVIQAGLKIGKSRLATDAVWDNFFPFVSQPALVQGFESPEDGLHIGGIHRFVSVIKIDPPAEAIYPLLPLPAITQDQVSADLIEVANAILKNV